MSNESQIKLLYKKLKEIKKHNKLYFLKDCQKYLTLSMIKLSKMF